MKSALWRLGGLPHCRLLAEAAIAQQVLPFGTRADSRAATSLESARSLGYRGRVLNGPGQALGQPWPSIRSPSLHALVSTRLSAPSAERPLAKVWPKLERALAAGFEARFPASARTTTRLGTTSRARDAAQGMGVTMEWACRGWVPLLVRGDHGVGAPRMGAARTGRPADDTRAFCKAGGGSAAHDFQVRYALRSEPVEMCRIP
jgi:hypothetical protein